MKDKYNGGDQVHTTYGAGMDIIHIGHSNIHTHDHGCDIVVKNVLHVPQAHKSLASVHKLTVDNDASMEFHLWFFLIKDRASRRILLSGRCKGGLYPLESLPSKLNKQAFSAFTVLVDRWHNRLGHPSSSVISYIVHHNNISCSSMSDKVSVCQACQRVKSHQLPYSKSSSVSTVPLQLVYSEVWGPAPTSVGRKKYYVSFIDDYSKYTWIYLLNDRSEVFQKFHEFQSLVERMLGRKIIAMQTD
jgi:hypothetical protein